MPPAKAENHGGRITISALFFVQFIALAAQVCVSRRTDSELGRAERAAAAPACSFFVQFIQSDKLHEEEHGVELS